jgi:hypothetical protein
MRHHLIPALLLALAAGTPIRTVPSLDTRQPVKHRRRGKFKGWMRGKRRK